MHFIIFKINQNIIRTVTWNMKNGIVSWSSSLIIFTAPVVDSILKYNLARGSTISKVLKALMSESKSSVDMTNKELLLETTCENMGADSGKLP